MWKKGDIILVHDYHLMLLPALLRDAHPKVTPRRRPTPTPARTRTRTLTLTLTLTPPEGGDRLVPAHALPLRRDLPDSPAAQGQLGVGIGVGLGLGLGLRLGLRLGLTLAPTPSSSQP